MQTRSLNKCQRWSGESEFSENNHAIGAAKKFVFTPYVDIILLWAKANHPGVSWAHLTAVIAGQYKLQLDQKLCEERYRSYLEASGISGKYKEFNESNEMIGFLWDAKRPQDFIHLYKELKR